MYRYRYLGKELLIYKFLLPFSSDGLLYWRPFVLDECVHFAVSSEPCNFPALRLASFASQVCSAVSLAVASHSRCLLLRSLSCLRRQSSLSIIFSTLFDNS